jgi:predicted nuclease of restriction endonuclease-like (RecB) superfamily
LALTEANTIETNSFVKIVELIQQSKQRAFASVNTELIDLYWNIGQYISNKTGSDGWGKSIVEELSRFIQKEMIGFRGFSPQNLWRMKQFYESYSQFPKLSTLLRELTWSNNLHILTKTKTIEEKEFYINLTVKEKYSARELERQINSAVYERFLLSHQKLSPLLRELEKPVFKQINEFFKYKYIF